MFEFLKRWIAQEPVRRDHRVVLFAKLSTESGPVSVQRVGSRVSRPSRRVKVVGSHRERIAAMRMEHLRICSPNRCQRLAQLGIFTAGDLAACVPNQIAQSFSASRRAAAAIKRLQTAVRLAMRIDGMMPRDAVLLIAVHRRNARTLARDSAIVIRRDLERLAMSSSGSRLVGNRGLPSLRRIKAWVREAGGHGLQPVI